MYAVYWQRRKVHVDTQAVGLRGIIKMENVTHEKRSERNPLLITPNSHFAGFLADTLVHMYLTGCVALYN